MSISIVNTTDYIKNIISKYINFDLNVSYKESYILRDKLNILFHHIVNNIQILKESKQTIPNTNIDFFKFINILFTTKLYNHKYKNIITKFKNKDNLYKYLITDKQIYSELFFLNDIIQKLFTEVGLNLFPTEIVNTFISPYIFDKIINLQNIININSVYKTNKLTLKIYCNEPNFIQIYIILIKCYILLEYFDITNKNITLNLFLTTLKKNIVHKATKKLTSSEINSGVTIHYPEETKIFIYRLEEIEKVTIHELIHALKLDKNIFNNYEYYDNKLKCNFNINKNNKIKLFEAFTETTSLIFNTTMNSIIFNKNLDELLQNEIKFNLFQCKKIMNYFDTTTIFSNNTCFKNNKIWIEDTSVLSYFYIKTITLLNMDYFLKNILIKGSSASYFDFILNNGEKLEFFINKINIDSIRDKNLLSMMRMSLYNLKFNI